MANLKQAIKTFSRILIILLLCTNIKAQVTKVWETPIVFKAPESVVYNSIRKCLYVSNFNDQSGFIKKVDTLHNEFLSKLDLEGNVMELKWIEGLHNPTGITIYKDKLYVVERKGLVIINIRNAKIEQRIPVLGAKFLNDIAIDTDGTIYISDTFKPCVFKIENQQSEVWYTDSLMEASNGLLLDNGHLLVGNRGAENLLSISLKDKTTKIIATGLSDNIDGMKKYKNGYFLSWKSELYLFENDTKKLLLELENKNDFAADFEFIEEEKLIVLPLLMSNKVVAFKIQ